MSDASFLAACSCNRSRYSRGHLGTSLGRYRDELSDKDTSSQTLTDPVGDSSWQDGLLDALFPVGIITKQGVGMGTRTLGVRAGP